MEESIVVTQCWIREDVHVFNFQPYTDHFSSMQNNEWKSLLKLIGEGRCFWIKFMTCWDHGKVQSITGIQILPEDNYCKFINPQVEIHGCHFSIFTIITSRF